MYYQSFQKHKRMNVFFFNGEVQKIDIKIGHTLVKRIFLLPKFFFTQFVSQNLKKIDHFLNKIDIFFIIHIKIIDFETYFQKIEKVVSQDK